MEDIKIKEYIKTSYKEIPKLILKFLGINNEEDLEIWFEYHEKYPEKNY